MNRIFVKEEELALVNGGYLVAGKKEIPVSNEKFIVAQKRAEWLILFAEKCKGKDFTGRQPDTINEVTAEVNKILEGDNVDYLKAPKKVKTELTSKLQEEALAFITHNEEVSKINKVNNYLQEFNIIYEFEEFGLYFKEDICKLNRIYTIAEIVKAAEAVINLVD